MAYAHCTVSAQVQGLGLGPGTMGFYITPCIVYITQGQGQKQGTIVFYCARPCPGLSPVQYVWAIKLETCVIHKYKSVNDTFESKGSFEWINKVFAMHTQRPVSTSICKQKLIMLFVSPESASGLTGFIN